MAVAGIFVGAGIGAASASGAELIMSSARPERSGSASGVNETLVEAAGALGIAVLGSVLVETGSFGWPLPVAAGVAAFVAVGVVLGLKPRPARADSPASRDTLTGDSSLCEPGYPARGRSLLASNSLRSSPLPGGFQPVSLRSHGSLNCEPGCPARGRFAPLYGSLNASRDARLEAVRSALWVAQLRSGIPGFKAVSLRSAMLVPQP